MSRLGRVARRSAGLAATVALALGAPACGSSGTAASGGTAASRPATAASRPATAGPTVTINDFAFSPKSLTVKAGTTVTWINQDIAVHDIKFTSGGIALSPLLMTKTAHASYSHTFTAAGTYPYICGIHPYMTGTVVVTP